MLINFRCSAIIHNTGGLSSSNLSRRCSHSRDSNADKRSLEMSNRSRKGDGVFIHITLSSALKNKFKNILTRQVRKHEYLCYQLTSYIMNEKPTKPISRSALPAVHCFKKKNHKFMRPFEHIVN